MDNGNNIEKLKKLPELPGPIRISLLLIGLSLLGIDKDNETLTDVGTIILIAVWVDSFMYCVQCIGKRGRNTEMDGK